MRFLRCQLADSSAWLCVALAEKRTQALHQDATREGALRPVTTSATGVGPTVGPADLAGTPTEERQLICSLDDLRNDADLGHGAFRPLVQQKCQGGCQS